MIKKQKIAVVVGGTGGIGSSVVSNLLERNYHVVTASYEMENFKPSSSFEVGLFVDVTNETSVLQLFNKIDSYFNRLDVLVNCSGVGIFKPMHELTLNEWNKVIDVNLTGAFLCAKEAFRRMRENNGGRIIHIGSVSDHVPLVDNAAYGSSKFALRGFTQILNEEGKEYNIRASLITLGAVNTRIWADRKEFDLEQMLLPDDVAEVIGNIADKSLRIRCDEIKLLPSKGIL